MLERISDEEIGLLEWESATLDMSFVDDYKDEIDTLLKAQLEADQKVVNEMIEEIEKNTSESLRRAGLFQMVMTEKEWQVFKKEHGELK